MSFYGTRIEQSSATFIRSLVVDEGRMKPGLSALTVMVRWQEGHPAHKSHITLI